MQTDCNGKEKHNGEILNNLEDGGEKQSASATKSLRVSGGDVSSNTIKAFGCLLNEVNNSDKSTNSVKESNNREEKEINKKLEDYSLADLIKLKHDVEEVYGKDAFDDRIGKENLTTLGL